MSLSTGHMDSKPSASRVIGLTSPIPTASGGRNLRQIVLAVVLPAPDRAWQAWKVWAFGSTGLSLNPYSGTWLANLLFSAERVGKGFLAAIVVAVPVGLAIGWN